MRIAAHRSTISTPATQPETSSKPAGASFFEVLAGTSAQSSNAGAASGFNLVQGRDSDAGDRGGQQDSTAKPQQQAEGKADPAQSATTQIGSRSNVAPVSGPQQPRSNTSGVSRPTERQEKTPASSTAIPIAIGTLPVPTAPVAIVPVTTPPVTVPPVITTPVPSPSDSAQSGNSVGAQKDQAQVASVAAQTQGESSRMDRVAHITNNDQNVPVTQDAKTATASQQPADDAPIESASQLSGSTASVAGFSLPAGTTPVVLPLSSTTISIADFLPGIGDANQLSANTTQAGKIGAANTTKTTPANVANSFAASQTASSATSASAQTHGVSNAAQGAQSAQHAQNQAAAATQPTGQAGGQSSSQAQNGSAAAQVQAITTHGATHEAVAGHGRTDGATETTQTVHTSERPAEIDAHEGTATAGINTANVIQKMNGTEMRVGMHSAEFGEVSIRTSVSQQQMTAQISVDDGDLGKAISAHIPAMEAKLGGEFGLRAVVEVSQSGMSFSGERDSSPQRQQGSYSQPAQVESAPAYSEPETTVARIAAVSGSESRNEYRLDIRA